MSPRRLLAHHVVGRWILPPSIRPAARARALDRWPARHGRHLPVMWPRPSPGDAGRRGHADRTAVAERMPAPAPCGRRCAAAAEAGDAEQAIQLPQPARMPKQATSKTGTDPLVAEFLQAMAADRGLAANSIAAYDVTCPHASTGWLHRTVISTAAARTPARPAGGLDAGRAGAAIGGARSAHFVR